MHRGNHLHSTFWNFRKPRKGPLHTIATKTLIPEDIENAISATVTEITDLNNEITELELRIKLLKAGV